VSESWVSTTAAGVVSGGFFNAAKAMFCSIVGRRLTSVGRRAESINIVRAVSAGVVGRDAVSISTSLSEDILPLEELWDPTTKNWPVLWVRTRFT
jgi:hypothetical protein